MEAIDFILTALMLGAAAGLRSTTEQAINDAYTGLKDLIQSKYPKVHADLLDNDPHSTDRKNVIKEDLLKANAQDDQELKQIAEKLIIEISSRTPDLLETLGVRIGVEKKIGKIAISKLTVREGKGAEVKAERIDEVSFGEIIVDSSNDFDDSPKEKTQ